MFDVCHGKFLFVLRDDKPDIASPNTWDIIGGGIDAGETPLECTIREIQEEVTITIRPEQLQLIKEYDFIYELSGRKFKGYWYFAKLTNDQSISAKLGDEGQEIRWMNLDEIQPLPKTKRLTLYFDEIKEVLEKCIQGTYTNIP